MRIENLFDPSKRIRRTIEKVITFSAAQEERLRAEIEEYVVTESIDEQVTDLLTKMQFAMDAGGPNEVGVWLSGFYGSGKSSLAKYLGFAFDDCVTIGDVRFLKYLQARLKTPTSKALLATVANRYPAAVVMLDLASEMVAGHTMEDVSTVLYYKVLHWAGYSRNLKVAALERRLKKDGRYEEFTSLVQARLGMPWADVQNDPLVHDSVLPEVAHQLYPALFPSVTSFSTGTADYIQFENERVAEMLDIVRAASGKQYVIFIIDEVGQYIAPRPNLILNLDGLAKNLKNIGDGKVWIIATAQQTLTEDNPRAALNSPQLFKLADRFPIKIDLPASDIKQICTERLLGKSAEGERELAGLYAKHGQALRHNIKLENARYYDADLDQTLFTDLYPFLPAHFDILLQLLGLLARSTGGLGLRSAIKVVQDILIDKVDERPALAERPLGELVTMATIYDALEKDIRRAEQSVHKGAAKAISHFPNSAIHCDVAKTVAVLQILNNMPITSQNIASLLHPGIAATSQRADVEAAIADLIADPFVPFGEQDGNLKFFSERINDIELERSQLPLRMLDQRRIQNEALRECLSPAPAAQVSGSLTVTTGLKTTLGAQVESLVGERETVQVQIELAEPADYENAKARLVNESYQQTNRNTIFLVARATPEIANHAAEIYRSREIVQKHRSDPEQEVRDYCAGQMTRVEKTLKPELERILRHNLGQGSFIFRGQATAVESLSPDLLAAAKRQVAEAAGQIFDRYSEAPVRTETATAELFLKAGGLKAVTTKLDPLNLVQQVGGKASIVNDHKAMISIRDYLDRVGSVDGRNLLDHFAGPPFGWSPDTLRYILAVMLVGGQVKLKISGREITVNGQQAIEALRTNNAFRPVGVALRDGQVKPETLARAADRLVKLTGDQVIPLEDDICKATRKYLAQAQHRFGPLAERLAALGLPGDERVRRMNDTVADILLGDASDAPERFGSLESPIYDSLTWASEVVLALGKNGLDTTVRNLQRHLQDIEALPASGLPGKLRDLLAERLQFVHERLEREDFYRYAADLSTALMDIEAKVCATAQAMQKAQAQAVHAALKELQALLEWGEFTQAEQAEFMGQVEAKQGEAPADLAGLKQLLNAEYEFTAYVDERKRYVVEEGRRRRIERIKGNGGQPVRKQVSLPAHVTSISALDKVIGTLTAVRTEIAAADDIDVTLTIEDGADGF